MSKTVKRAMRVMMIGLVALLGANAEAHYVVVSGKYKYCSVCVDADFKNQEPLVLPIPHTEVAEFVVTIAAGKGEILCSDGIHTSLNEVILRVLKPIVQGNTTQATFLGSTITTTKVEAVLSDAAFNELLLNVCPMSQLSTDRLIREMSVDIKTYCEIAGDLKCKGVGVGFDPYDSEHFTCSLANTFSLNNYPFKLPPPGTPYRCLPPP